MRKLTTSVIIPVCNAQTTIIKCLKAIKKQTLKPQEVIVVDDGSKDNTAQVAKKWATVISNTRQKGPGGSRNTGAYAAKGKILVFTDSDCITPKRWLEKIVLAFSNPQVGAVGGGYSSGIDNNFWQRFSAEELRFRRKNRQGQVTTLVSNNMAVRKTVFMKEKGFPEQYPVCEDMLLSYKISRRHKVLWLKNNNVKHHFKNSFKEFLTHQYFFGKESTKFFLKNPNLFFRNNHQGKLLHLAIIISFLSLVNLTTTIVLFILGKLSIGKLLLGVLIILLSTHLLLYLRFILYLHQKGFSNINILRGYLTSFLRDLVSGFSFFDGLAHRYQKTT